MVVRIVKFFAALYIMMIALYMQSLATLTFLHDNNLLSKETSDSFLSQKLLKNFNEFNNQTKFFINSFALIGFLCQILLLIYIFYEICSYFFSKIFKGILYMGLVLLTVYLMNNKHIIYSVLNIAWNYVFSPILRIMKP